MFVIYLSLVSVPLAIAQPGEAIVLEISGEGVERSLQFTLPELQTMSQHQQVYSTINTWPTKTWYVAEGVMLRELLKAAGIKSNAQLINFTSRDGFITTLTVKELLVDKRYHYPNFMDNGQDGSIPGSSAGAFEVQPILALLSVEGSNNPQDMNDMNLLLLVCGQRTVTEQTNNLFLKNVSKIEVITEELLQWDPPKALLVNDETTGETFIELTSKVADTDKVHYTTDGSTPTVDSPMYNWKANRWRSQRMENHNQGIKITEDMVVKAITIGPGKKDSDIAIFTFQIEADGRMELTDKVPIGITLDRNQLILNRGASFWLDATVNIDEGLDKTLMWESSDTRLATVDSSGWVTVMGLGEAIITVRTVGGNYTATCKVTGANRGDNAKEIDYKLPIAETIGEEYGESLAAEVDINESAPDEEDEEEVLINAMEPPINMQYLASRGEMAATNSNVAMMSNGVWQVFELSIDEVSVTEETNINAFMGISAISLFLIGASRRYLEFKRGGN